MAVANGTPQEVKSYTDSIEQTIGRRSTSHLGKVSPHPKGTKSSAGSEVESAFHRGPNQNKDKKAR